MIWLAIERSSFLPSRCFPVSPKHYGLVSAVLASLFFPGLSCCFVECSLPLLWSTSRSPWLSRFFTLLHWLNALYPSRISEVSLRDHGVTRSFGKQTMEWDFHRLSGWSVVERQFERRVLLVLLLQLRFGLTEIALTDTNLRDRVVQIFHAKRIPEIPHLRPTWERT